jgi:hypothetical protein
MGSASLSEKAKPPFEVTAELLKPPTAVAADVL